MRGDLEWRSTAALARSAAQRFADAEAIVDGDARITYRELGDAATSAGHAFVALGVEPGDRVAIWAPNMHEWVVALLGLHSAGAVLVPLNTRYKGTEAAFILRKSRARLLLTVNGFLGTDYPAMLEGADLPDLEQIVLLRGDAPGALTWADFLAKSGDVPASAIDERIAALGPGDTSDILFTSGTTGAPKGVVCTHGQSLRAFADWAEVVGLRPGDRYLLVNPMFHTFGYKAGILASLMAGATIVPLPVFDVDAVLRTIPAERVTMVPGPPTLYQSLLAHPGLGDADLGSLRLAVTGAAVIPVELVKRVRDELGFETVITGYGLTEANGIATMCRFDDDIETIATTSGRAIPGVEVCVVDDEGEEVPAGEPGEVAVRGYNVTQGYFEEPGETAAAIDPNGWLHTGDIGVMDERGYLRITDRKKDMFIVGGFNAYPAEIESLLLAHPAIAQAAVVGVPDERLGEVGVAYVVLCAGATADGLHAWARDHMANYKVPRRIEIVDALPLNASGKVLKYELPGASPVMSEVYAHLLVERRGPVGWLTLDRPDSYNAMNVAMIEELPHTWAELDADDAVRVIVTTGAGKGFCTGVDVKELAGDPRGMTAHADRVKRNQLGITAIHNRVWKPVICAVNGVCAGGGLHFVADADIVLAASTATFVDPHVSVGQVSTYEPIGLRLRMPFDAVARMLFVGRHERLSAARAHELGLVGEVVDPPEDLPAAAQALGELIARNSPSAMMASKKALWESLDAGLTAGLANGARILSNFWDHPDNVEGPLAFTEKREPVWAPPTKDL